VHRKHKLAAVIAEFLHRSLKLSVAAMSREIVLLHSHAEVQYPISVGQAFVRKCVVAIGALDLAVVTMRAFLSIRARVSGFTTVALLNAA